MKRIVATMAAVLFCAGAVAGLSACGEDKSKQIVVWCEATGSDKDVLDAFTQYFNENNDMGYTMTYKMHESVTADLQQAALGGTAPDLCIWPRWETLSKTKLVHDLTDKIAGDGTIDLNAFNAAARRELEVKGGVYGIPLDLDAWGLWCNMDLMTEDQLPTTWEELKTVTRTLTTGSGDDTVVGLDAYNLRGQFYSFSLTNGYRLVDDSSNPPKINIDIEDKGSDSYKKAEEIMQLFIDLMDITKCPSEYQSDEKFMQGKVAMKFSPSNYGATVKALGGKEMNLKFIGYPAKSATEGAVAGMLGGYSLAIPASKDLDKGFEIIKWWLQDENLTKYCELYNFLPAKTSLQSAPFVAESQVLMALKEMLPACDVRPIVKGYPNVETTWIFATIDALREYIRTGTGSITDAEQALRQIKEKGDQQFNLEALL